MFHIAFECVDDGNNFGYKPECDSDINKFDTGDLKDLTKAGLGTAGREIGINAEFLVFLVMILIILGAITTLWLRSKGYFRSGK